MTENYVEMIGLREVQLAHANAEYAKLWNLLNAIKENRKNIDQVTMSVLPNGQLSWSVEAEAEPESEVENDR